jgi:hypothetical protein
VERHPSALVFSVASLHLLVHAFLDFALEDSGAGGLVEIGDLEDVCCIDPVVCATSHYMVASDV